MPDEIKQPEPKAWHAHYPGIDGELQEKNALYDCEPTGLTYLSADVTPLYTRADVIAWARAVIKQRNTAQHSVSCPDPALRYCTCGAARENQRLAEILDELDTAAREWEESENA